MTVDCVLPLPLEGTFSYNVPAHLCDCVRVGCRVNVPFGRSKQFAVEVEVDEVLVAMELGCVVAADALMVV